METNMKKLGENEGEIETTISETITTSGRKGGRERIAGVCVPENGTNRGRETGTFETGISLFLERCQKQGGKEKERFQLKF